MSLIFIEKLFLVILIISATLMPASLAGRHPGFEATESDVGASKIYEEPSMEKPEAVVWARLLRMNAHDYGNYNPTPSLSKPRYKLIPN